MLCSPPSMIGRSVAGALRLLCVVTVALIASGCGERRDPVALNRCAQLIRLFEDHAVEIRIIERASSGDEARLVYEAAGQPHQLDCRFARDGEDVSVIGLARDGELVEGAKLALLLGWFDAAERGRFSRPEPIAPSAEASIPGPDGHGLFFDLLINGLIVGAIYALVACGYAQIFSMLEIVNFAFGEVHAIGAYGVVAVTALLAGFGAETTPGALLLALAVAILVAGAAGLALDALVYRPFSRQSMRREHRLLPLVAALGASILIQNALLAAQGGRAKWVQPFLPIGATRPILLLIVALCLGAALWIERRTPLGRQQRAISEDRVAAALMGVDLARTIRLSFVLSGALAGASGALAMAYYGVAEPTMGWSVAIKALSAAVLGGLGSLGGAIAGGFAIGLVEAYWAGYVDGASRDIVVFALLIATLILRPTGFAGRDGASAI